MFLDNGYIRELRVSRKGNVSRTLSTPLGESGAMIVCGSPHASRRGLIFQILRQPIKKIIIMLPDPQTSTAMLNQEFTPIFERALQRFRAVLPSDRVCHTSRRGSNRSDAGRHRAEPGRGNIAGRTASPALYTAADQRQPAHLHRSAALRHALNGGN